MIRGVLFDWRGTLVADPPEEWWVATALERLGRNGADAPAVVEALEAASRTAEVAEHTHDLDCSATLHREATMRWFRTAGLDDEVDLESRRLERLEQARSAFPVVNPADRGLVSFDQADGCR